MPYDSDQINDLDAEIDALPDGPTTLDVFGHSKDYNPDVVAASAVRRALGGGGGGTPAGDTGEIQFNDNGAFGADEGLVWERAGGNRILRLVTAANGSGQIIGNGPGVQLTLTAADGDASHPGGEIQIQSGGSAGQSGGNVQITAGSDSVDGEGGAVTIWSGRSQEGDGGDIIIRANGFASTGGNGGQVAISGGQGDGGGGDVIIAGGSGDGNVQMYSGDGNQYIQLDNANGLQIGATKLGFYQGGSVVQPVVPLTTPSVQDVIDALVALGLVAQHD